MKFLIFVLLSLCLALGQIRPRPIGPRHFPDGEAPSPSPKLDPQREAILKADYKKNLEEAAELVKLAEDLKAEIEKDERYVVSVKALKETDDIEKLVKSIRGRLKRF
jgi:hypothetical protein